MGTLLNSKKRKRNGMIQLFHLLLVFILIGFLSPSPLWADDSSVSDKEGIGSSGGKRSRAEIHQLIRQMRERFKAGLPEDPSERWLKKAKDEKGKFTVQKDFAHAVHAAENLIKKAQWKQQQGLDLSKELEELLNKKRLIEKTDEALRLKFSETEQRCKSEGFSNVVLERHLRMVDNCNRNVRILLDHLNALEQWVEQEAWEKIPAEMQRVRDHLEEYQTLKEPPLISDSLPHGLRIVEAPVIEKEKEAIPSLSPVKVIEKTEKSLPKKEIRPSGPVVGEGIILPMAVTGSPVPEDLKPTIDVQITQEVIDLAENLNNSPIEIFEYVRNHMDFDPYLGSRKGSQETLNQKSGNDYDLSSLLIALLRAANIPARYVRGTVELPVERAMNWLGVEHGATAGSILTTVGMEGVNIMDGGEVVAVRFKHVWVEAYIPYTNYRGIPVDETGKMWVPMDPSFKGYSYQSGVDILTEMGFDPESFIDDYITTYHEPSPAELMMQEILDFLTANHPELSYADILRTRSIAVEDLGFIPGSLPFEILSIQDDFAEIPSDKRYTVRFRLYDGATTFIDYTANLPEIAGKRITISYIAATQADQDVIDSYGDLYDTPPYLVNLKPVLKIDGADVTVASNSIGMGRTHSSDMHFTTPVGENNEMPVVANSIIAGTYQAVGIDTGKINPDLFMPDAGPDAPTNDDLTGGKLWKTAMGYLDRIERYDGEIAKTMQMVVTKDVSEAIVENTILVTYSFGTPQTFEWTGLVVDADRCIVGPFAVDGDSSKSKPFMVFSGADGSVSENRIFEDMYDEEAVSAIKILELASDMGIPIYTFNSGNIGSIYSSLNLSSSVESAIYSAVAGGHEVTVPRDNITYLEWYGTGYIDMDPTTGAAGYIISGGHSGGATVDVWVSWKMVWFTIFRDLCDIDPITATITFPPANSYFPALSWMDFLFNNQLRFDVTYTICYEGGGTRTVYETYNPHYPYPPGDYTFYAGWDTGQTCDFTVFGVEIETPDGERVFIDCDSKPSITLKSIFTPRQPPAFVLQWEKGSGVGDGDFSAPMSPITEFTGTIGGTKTVTVKVSNTNGEARAEKSLIIIKVGVVIELKDEEPDGDSTPDERDASGLDMTTLSITLNGHAISENIMNVTDITAGALTIGKKFEFTAPCDYFNLPGNNTLKVNIKDKIGNAMDEITKDFILP